MIENEAELQIDIEIYSKVVDQVMAAKEQEIFGLRVQVAQLQANLDKIKSQTDNITNSDTKGV